MKCTKCGKEILSDGIYAPKKSVSYWWHIDCYKNDKNYDEFMFESYLEDSKPKLKEQKEKSEFNDYISKKYDFFMSKREFQKLADIRSGNFSTKEYPNGIKPITYGELLFMFNKMEDFLSKINVRFKSEQDKFNYHLAVVFNKYPSYLEHKKKQEQEKPIIIQKIPEYIIQKKKEAESDSFSVEDYLL